MEFLFIGVLATCFTMMVIITKICRRLRQRHYEVPAPDMRKGHRWCMLDLFQQPTYCCISEQRIIEGAVCYSCGICVSDQNASIANKRLRCKEPSNEAADGLSRHHWVRGNLPSGSRCSSCAETCGDRMQLCDLRCCWCMSTVHDQCRASVDDVCDLGPYRESIVPPGCLRLKLVGVKGRRRLVVESVRDPGLAGWRPLIIMANRKSGNGDAEHILQAFRGLLNPVQV